jgi:hypothetical protein
MTRWETLEAHLSFMYSIFERRPLVYAVIENYGRESKIFRDRIGSLRKSAEKYFQSQPNQQAEARVECLIEEANRLSSFRHRIAHGVVIGLTIDDHIEYRLVPPTHGVFHLTKNDGYYGYTPAEIDGYATQFADLARQIRQHNHELHPAV